MKPIVKIPDVIIEGKGTYSPPKPGPKEEPKK